MLLTSKLTLHALPSSLAEARTHSVAQADLELAVLLFESPKWLLRLERGTRSSSSIYFKELEVGFLLQDNESSVRHHSSLPLTSAATDSTVSSCLNFPSFTFPLQYLLSFSYMLLLCWECNRDTTQLCPLSPLGS